MTAAIHVGLEDVAATLALVAVAVAVAVWERTDLEGDIAIAVARSFIQLTAIGYVIKAVFASDSIAWVVLLLAVMVAFGALTGRARAPRVPHAFSALLLALAIAATATLALGATATEAIRPIARRSLRSGMIPLIDSTKTTGLIFFPGTMVGMLLAGASPVDAVRLQLVLLYILLGAVALAVLLSRRAFFTAEHQLRDMAPPPSTRNAGA